MPAASPFADDTVEGRKVTKARATGPGGEKHEAWTDTDLGLVVFSRVDSPGFTMAKSLRNVKVRDPHPSLFKVPKGRLHRARRPAADAAAGALR